MPSPPLSLAVAAAIGGGLVTNLAFPYHSWWLMAPVGYALLVLALHRASPRRGLSLGLLWGLAFFLPLLSWSLVSVGQWVPWVALSVLQALFAGLYGLLHAFVLSRRVPAGRGAVVAGLLWVSLEQLRSVAPFGGFPWGVLGFSQVDGPLLYLAAWGGTAIVSLVVVLSGYAIAALALTPGLRPLAGAVVMALVVAGSGLLVPAASAESGEIAVTAVQGNVPVRGAEAAGQARQITTNYRALTEGLAADGTVTDVVVWPESAADLDPRSHPDVAADVTAAQEAIGVPLLFGTQRYTESLRYNEYLGWQDGEEFAVYAKQHPVPFGEYIPYRDFFRRLSSAVDLVGVDMAAGEEPGVMDVPIASLGRDVTFGVGICFEVAYRELLRESVSLGAELLVIPTNNASFGFTQEATQQLALSRFRAVEHGRSTIQVSTVGVSAMFLADGTVVARSSDELYTEWAATETLPLRTSTTVSDMLGDWPRNLVWVLALAWVLAAAAGSRGRER
ncbi:MAG: apolipoprotein N-acyltransferase [Actinomycetota bacterium]